MIDCLSFIYLGNDEANKGVRMVALHAIFAHRHLLSDVYVLASMVNLVNFP